MPLFINGDPIEGTDDQDYLFGVFSGPDNNINGNDGNDLIFGDFPTFFSSNANNSSIATAQPVDGAGNWNTGIIPIIADSTTIPHTSIYIEGEAGQQEFFSVTVGAGETLTADTDFSSFDTLLTFLLPNGAIIAFNDDNGSDPGSEFSTFFNGGTLLTDSFLTYTNNTGAEQTIIVRVGEFGGDRNLDGAEDTTLLHLSVTGHDALGTFIEGDDVLNGGEGNDLIFGLGGADTINGGAGNDILVGGETDLSDGPDTINGGDGDDTIIGGFFVDIINGDAGNDTFVFRDNHFIDVLDGGADIDTLDFSDYDVLDANPNVPFDWTVDLAGETYQRSQGNVDANGIQSIVNVENVIAGGGNDTLIGNDLNNELSGNGGNDTINGGIGDDILDGGLGDDILDGGMGVDTASYANSVAGVTVDLSLQGQQQDTIGAGMDTLSNIQHLTGSDFGDVLIGDANDNVLRGGLGNDTFHGGAGFDRVFISTDVFADVTGSRTADGTVTLTSSGVTTMVNEIEFIDFNGLSFLLSASNGFSNTERDVYTGTDDNEILAGGGGNDALRGEGGIDFIFGGDGRDVLRGGDGIDVLRGDAGNDRLFGGDDDSTDFISGGDGIDLIFGQGGDDQLDGGEGVDKFFGGDGNDTIRGGNGNDAIFGDDGNDLIFGDDGNDRLRGRNDDDRLEGGEGDDNLKGGNGVDILIGDAGNDVIFGQSGNDSLLGGAGNDQLFGGSGNDTFFFLASDGAGTDRVNDFEAGDQIQLMGFGFADIADAADNFVQFGNNVRFTFGDITINFVDATLAEVQAAIVFANAEPAPIEKAVVSEGLSLDVGKAIIAEDMSDNVASQQDMVAEFLGSQSLFDHINIFAENGLREISQFDQFDYDWNDFGG